MLLVQCPGVSNDEICEKASNLSISLYVRAENGNGNGNGSTETVSLKQAIANWQESSMVLRESMDSLLAMLEKGLSVNDADGGRLRTDLQNLSESVKPTDSKVLAGGEK